MSGWGWISRRACWVSEKRFWRRHSTRVKATPIAVWSRTVRQRGRVMGVVAMGTCTETFHRSRFGERSRRGLVPP